MKKLTAALLVACALGARADESNVLHHAVVRVEQRASGWLPSETNQLLRLTLDDITRGQVMVSLADAKGRPVLALTSMRSGRAAEFEFAGQPLVLVCHRLVNELIGEDAGVFTVRGDAASVAAVRARETVFMGKLADPIDRLDSFELLQTDLADPAMERAFRERVDAWRALQPRRLLTEAETDAFWEVATTSEAWLDVRVATYSGAFLPLLDVLRRHPGAGEVLLDPDALLGRHSSDLHEQNRHKLPDPPAAVRALLDRIGKSALLFVRDEEAHAAPLTERHLHLKWVALGASIADPEEFIHKVATRSSRTGVPYLVRFHDDTTQPLADWLRGKPREAAPSP